MAASARALVVRAHTKIQTNSKEVPKSLSRNTKPFSKQILYVIMAASVRALVVRASTKIQTNSEEITKLPKRNTNNI